MHFTLGTHPWAKNYNKTQGKSGISMRKLREPAFPGKRRWFGPSDRSFLSYEYYTCLESRWANIQEIRPPSILWISWRTHQAVHLSKIHSTHSENQPIPQTPKKIFAHSLAMICDHQKHEKYPTPTHRFAFACNIMCIQAALIKRHARTSKERATPSLLCSAMAARATQIQNVSKLSSKTLRKISLFMIHKHTYSTHTHHKT